MDKETKEGISQVLDILNHTDKNIVEKISKKFIEFLRENREIDYKANIDYSNKEWKNQINEDAKVILALIYRDFIVSDEERENLIKNEEAINKQYQKEISDKYSVDTLFKNSNKKVGENKEIPVSLIEVKEKKWYKNILDKILAFFGKNK